MHATLSCIPAVWVSAAPKRILNPGSCKQAISCVCADSCLVHCVNVDVHILNNLKQFNTCRERQRHSKKLHLLCSNKQNMVNVSYSLPTLHHA